MIEMFVFLTQWMMTCETWKLATSQNGSDLVYKQLTVYLPREHSERGRAQVTELLVSESTHNTFLLFHCWLLASPVLFSFKQLEWSLAKAILFP